MTVTARQLSLDALDRIERDGAYANLVLPELLGRTGLAPRDRHFATELVYGTTRMRRACDFLVDRFLTRELDPRVRNALRLGAYQLHFLAMAPHAAVGETVEVAPKAARGLVNAVLRRVASAPPAWPDDATRLSYPDWVVDTVVADLGAADGMRRPRGDEHGAAGHRARGRLRAGPRLAVGGRSGGGASRASGWPTCAPRPAARRCCWPPPGRRVVAADIRREPGRASWRPTRRGRRRRCR